MPTKAQTDWDEQRALVLAELKRLNQGIEDLKLKIDQLYNSDLSDLKSRMAVMQAELKLKSGAWGFLAGAIPALVVAIYFVLSR